MSKSDHEKIEQPICKRLVTKALEAGFTVSVYDGEEWALKRSTNKAEIVAAMFSTDCDTLRFRAADGTVIGSVALIYGNGAEVISDYSDKPVIEQLVNAAQGSN
jgi:hypothetical protein